MSNLGFRRAMAAAGIEVVETPVGDRHVLEALERVASRLGGEQSGHLVFAELAPPATGCSPRWCSWTSFDERAARWQSSLPR